MPDLGLIAEAVAARYAPAALPSPPAGAKRIRSSSANLPNAIPATPAILVFTDQGTFEAGAGTRLGAADYLVRLYYDKHLDGDLERDSEAIRDWMTLLVDQHKAQLQLGGLVVAVRTMAWRIGILPYGGLSYTGAELRVRTVTSEPWAASA